jgi:flagellar biosynthesis protein FliR
VRPLFDSVPELGLAVVCELLVGIIIGLAVRLLFR